MNLESYKLTTGIVQKEMLDESLPFFNLDTSIGISIKLVAFALINLHVRFEEGASLKFIYIK